MNAFDIFGIPSAFGLSLLTLSLILSLSSYFSGVDFGVIKVPKLKSKAQKRLKFVGPILIVGTISFYMHLTAFSFAFHSQASTKSPII